MRQVSLARLLGAILLIFVLVPAAVVSIVMARGSLLAVEQMAGNILSGVADRIQVETQAHLRRAHAALDGVVGTEMTDAQKRQARRWLRELPQLEPMAFAIVRQSTDVPRLQAANLKGEYLGVELTGDGMVVSLRAQGEPRRRLYQARQPGDRENPLPAEVGGYEPRTRYWYEGALRETRRVFTPVSLLGAKDQLGVTLSQPVYDDDGGAAGVIAVELRLAELASRLRVQRISARGAAYIIDDKGFLVASSAGDPLSRQDGAGARRTRPHESSNESIRVAAAAFDRAERERPADSVAVDTSLQRVPYGDAQLMMVQRPFGQELGLRWTLVVAAPETDFTQTIADARRVSAIVISVIVLLGALAAWGVARRIGGRLERLGAAASSMGRGEIPNVDSRTRIREVAELSQVVHESAMQLRAYRERVEADAVALEEANSLLEARVAARTAELAASREEALAAARAKAAFLATMSHEIRTPLNGVVGMSALLAETQLNAEQRDYLQTIRLSSDQLLAVINDILDFSKIESGKLDLESEPLSLRTVIEEACDIAAPRAREKGLELIVDVPDPSAGGPPPAIRGDVTRLRQVLINLINNAVKFTDRGEVAVHARQCGTNPGGITIEFRVTDTGIGIPPERVNSLFQAFTQVDASTTRKYGGTGLGLAICKRLAELMGGTIGVESRVGEGSSFWFTVAAQAAEMPEPVLAPQASVLGQSRVLIVDDHATNIRILSRQLQLWGMQVSSVESALDALAQLERPPLPDVIITDMHMPGMDGIEFASRVKAMPLCAGIPIVLLSSGFMPGGHEHAGLFDARLLKPARQTQLFDALARCLSSDYARQARQETPRDARRDITVLVADDNAVNLKVACAMLTRLGYDFVTADDGLAALERVRERFERGGIFGAVLMDVNMPRMDGLEATRALRDAWGDRAPPTIAVTAGASAEDRARCEAAGMQDYLTKPLQVAALALALERWTAGRENPEPPPAITVARANVDLPDEPPRWDETQGPPLMDFSRLAEFREFDDEELSMTREVAGLFIQDAPGRIAAIEQAVRDGDPAAVSRAAHALKGASGNVGAAAICDLCSELERDTKAAGVPADVAQRIERLHLMWPATQAAIEQWLATPG